MESGTQSVGSSVGDGNGRGRGGLAGGGKARSVTERALVIDGTCEVAVSVSETRMAVSFR